MPTYYAPGERTAAKIDVSENNTTQVQLVNPIKAAAAAAAARRKKQTPKTKRPHSHPSTKLQASTKHKHQTTKPRVSPPTSLTPPSAATQATATARSVFKSSTGVSEEVQQARDEFDSSLKRLFPHAAHQASTHTPKNKRPTEYLSNYRNLAVLRSPQGLKPRRPIRPDDTPAILHDGSGGGPAVSASVRQPLIERPARVAPTAPEWLSDAWTSDKTVRETEEQAQFKMPVNPQVGKQVRHGSTLDGSCIPGGATVQVRFSKQTEAVERSEVDSALALQELRANFEKEIGRIHGTTPSDGSSGDVSARQKSEYEAMFNNLGLPTSSSPEAQAQAPVTRSVFAMPNSEYGSSFNQKLLTSAVANTDRTWHHRSLVGKGDIYNPIDTEKQDVDKDDMRSVMDEILGLRRTGEVGASEYAAEFIRSNKDEGADRTDNKKNNKNNTKKMTVSRESFRSPIQVLAEAQLAQHAQQVAQRVRDKQPKITEYEASYLAPPPLQEEEQQQKQQHLQLMKEESMTPSSINQTDDSALSTHAEDPQTNGANSAIEGVAEAPAWMLEPIMPRGPFTEYSSQFSGSRAQARATSLDTGFGGVPEYELTRIAPVVPGFVTEYMDSYERQLVWDATRARLSGAGEVTKVLKPYYAKTPKEVVDRLEKQVNNNNNNNKNSQPKTRVEKHHLFRAEINPGYVPRTEYMSQYRDVFESKKKQLEEGPKRIVEQVEETAPVSNLDPKLTIAIAPESLPRELGATNAQKQLPTSTTTKAKIQDEKVNEQSKNDRVQARWWKREGKQLWSSFNPVTRNLRYEPFSNLFRTPESEYQKAFGLVQSGASALGVVARPAGKSSA